MGVVYNPFPINPESEGRCGLNVGSGICFSTFSSGTSSHFVARRQFRFAPSTWRCILAGGGWQWWTDTFGDVTLSSQPGDFTLPSKLFANCRNPILQEFIGKPSPGSEIPIKQILLEGFPQMHSLSNRDKGLRNVSIRDVQLESLRSVWQPEISTWIYPWLEWQPEV